MDSPSEMQAEPKPEGSAAEAHESTAAAGPKDAASISADAQDTSQAAEMPPEQQETVKASPIPSSALVILPPHKRRFDAQDAGDGPAHARRAQWLHYGSRAAIALVLFGCAFAAAGHFLGSAPTTVHVAASSATPSWPVAKEDNDAAEMHRDTKTLGEEIHRLETRVDSLRIAVQAQTPEEVRSLKRSIESLKASLEAERAQANTSIAQLSAKLDRLQHEEPRATQASLGQSEHAENSSGLEQAASPKAIQATLDRAARAEKNEPLTTGSIPATAASHSATAVPQPLAMAEAQKRPQLLSNWVVRDVYDGIALVEGPQGAIEVMPGDTLPGAGTVKAIERRGGGWIVVTSRGLVDYERD